MSFIFKTAVAILILVCASFDPAVAGPFEDGSNAWDRGDFASAMRLLRPLADRGDPRAQNRVGVMYQRGWGVPLDYADAVSWFRQAANQGDADAQSNLAFMYLYGRGVSRDYIRAHMWFSLAASGGVISASLSRDLLAARMTPVQVAKAQKQAHEWKSADDPRHLFQLQTAMSQYIEYIVNSNTARVRVMP
jgi:TPR repeat protein